MSDSEQKDTKNKKDKKDKVNPIILTLREMRKLEDAAEAGDIEAQKKLAESEGVETYDEYKRIQNQWNEELQDGLSAAFDSIREQNKNMGIASMAGISDDLLKSVTVEDEWKHSMEGLGQSLLDAAGISKNIAELRKSLSEDVIGNASTYALIESALAQSSIAENLLAKGNLEDEMRTTFDALSKRQELFEIAEETKTTFAKMAEDNHLTEMLSGFAKTEMQDIASNLIPNKFEAFGIESERVQEESFRLPPEILYAPPSSDIERTEEIRRSNELQEELIEEVRNLRIAIEKKVVVTK